MLRTENVQEFKRSVNGVFDNVNCVMFNGFNNERVTQITVTRTSEGFHTSTMKQKDLYTIEPVDSDYEDDHFVALEELLRFLYMQLEVYTSSHTDYMILEEADLMNVIDLEDEALIAYYDQEILEIY